MNIHHFKKQNHHYNNINMASPSSTSSGNSLGIHKHSRLITKVQPKIRIIHIFAPEIIKTDVANFRELVQRLTGKPAPGSIPKGKDKDKGKKVKKSSPEKITVGTKQEFMMRGVCGSSSSPSSSSDHHQEVGWRSSSSCDNHNNNISGVGGVNGGGYLTSFTDLDDSFDFSNVFQMGGNDGSTHLNAFGVATQLSFRG